VTVWASAPPAVPLLGTPFDRQFRAFPTGSLFSDSRVRATTVNEFRHERILVDTSEGLHANASAWGIVGVNGSIDYSQRYAAFRAFHLSQVVEIDDSVDMEEAPSGSVYYLWRVYLGHAYEEVVSGDANKFSAGVRATFPMASGAIASFARSNHLQSWFLGRGMTPTSGQALFASSPVEIQSSYSIGGPEVPIFVEYRQLPSTVADRSVIPWIEPLRARVRFTGVTIVDDGSWWTTIWSIRTWCEVNGRRMQPSQDIKHEERVEEGQSYTSSWEREFPVMVGDTFRCGTSAYIHDDATPLQSAGEGAIDSVSAASGLQRVGTINAGNAKASYRVNWAVEVR
jgi:hypothetical protein